MERIRIEEDGREVSHLAVQYDPPAKAPGEAPGEGTGLCILYLHGFGSMQAGEKAEFFRGRARENGFGFCSFDFQGHGQSGGSLRDLTLTRNLEDIGRVHEFLRERGQKRLCLMGSSMGGAAALWYSALQPESIAAGLHIAPALDLERGLTAWAGPERCRTWEETGFIHFQNDLVACELSWAMIEDLRAHSMDELMRRYRTPALLLQGVRDQSVPWKTVADFATRCPYPIIDLHLFADGDHRLTDRMDRLWDLMMEFLRGHGVL